MRQQYRWQSVISLIVILFILTLAVSPDTFEANASSLWVVNRGPCLIYEEPNLTAKTDRITDPTFDVDLDVCVRIIGALSSNYAASSQGWVYGLHTGSVGASQIAIQTNDKNNHSAWVKKVSEKNWTKYADNWWEPPEMTIQ